MAINYQVKQGDCIFSIAVEHGFFADTIWNDPNNAELKKKRENPNVLLPGDVVFIRDKQLKEVSEPTNQVHKFRCKNTPKTLRIQLMYFNTPIKNMDYKLDIDGKETKGKTDGEGWLKQSILPNAKIAKLELANGSTYNFKLGNVDPVENVTGLQGRLYSLGFYKGAINGQLNDETKSALRDFQRSQDLDITGEADDQTKELLIQMTGS